GICSVSYAVRIRAIRYGQGRQLLNWIGSLPRDAATACELSSCTPKSEPHPNEWPNMDSFYGFEKRLRCVVFKLNKRADALQLFHAAFLFSSVRQDYGFGERGWLLSETHRTPAP